jgi:hypothetical protein
MRRAFHPTWLWAVPLIAALAALGHGLRAAPPSIGTTVAIVDATNPAAPNQAGVDSSGNLKVNCLVGCSAGSGTGADNADGVAAVGTGLGSSVSYGYVYNGTSWDRLRGDATNGAFVNVKQLPANASVNLNQVGGTAVATGHGTAAGALRVELPTDGTGVVGLAAGASVVGKVGIDQTTPGTTNGVAVAPSANAGVGITRVVSGAAENNHVLKASAGNLYGVYATNLTATSGFLVVLNATSAPADGAITPLACVPLPANSFGSINYAPGPPAIYATGITAVVTSAASCFTKTTGTITAFIGGHVQ